MNDRREQILAQLVTIAGTLPGVTRTLRNRDLATGRSGPTIIIHDGDEAVSVQSPRTQGRITGAPRLMEMTPEFQILAEATAADIGSQLNALRAAAVGAVMSDDMLLSITGANGDIRYDGAVTTNKRGEKIEGGLALNFAFIYPLLIDELTS